MVDALVKYRPSNIVYAPLSQSSRQMDALLKEKNVPTWIDYWGFDSAHDWAWWRKQIVYFIDKLLAPDTDYVI